MRKRLKNTTMMPAAEKTRKSLGFLSVTSIGIGGMIGGGIFALLGLAVSLAHGGTPVAFLVGGLVALITAYSYAKLSVAYPSQGGTVEFINQAFGEGIVTGALNILLWMSYVVMLSLYSYAFGSYAASFFPAGAQGVLHHVFLTSILLLITGLNLIGARAVGRLETYIVGVKLAILLLFCVAGYWSIEWSSLQTASWSPALDLLAGGMIIFVAYEGFELIANTAQDVRKPEKTLPRAYYASVILVAFIYIAVAAVAVGNLSVDEISRAQDYALAEAARPFLGQIGFSLIGIAALLSTSSAINATLYGTARVSYIIAKDGELPQELERQVWKQPAEGLIITACLTIIVANLLDLTSIAAMGSSGFLIIFAAVNLANYRLAGKTGANRAIALGGVAACSMALAAMAISVAGSSPASILVIVFMIAASLTIEIAYRRYSGRTIKPVLR